MKKYLVYVISLDGIGEWECCGKFNKEEMIKHIELCISHGGTVEIKITRAQECL